MAKKKNEQKRKGRSKVAINWQEVEKLLEAGCKTGEVAGYFGIDSKTLYNRCEQDLNMTFSALKQQKRKKGNSMLRTKQFAKALNGDSTMQIWLGKQRLEQSEPKDKQGKTKIELPKIEIMIDNVNE